MLTSLPRSRPVRRSAKRGDRVGADPAAVTTPPRRAAPAKAAKARPKATAATAGEAANAAPKATPKAAPKATTRTSTPPRRKVPPAGYAAPTGRGDEGGGSGTADMLSTTIQAAADRPRSR